jgi:hypothetical protein
MANINVTVQDGQVIRVDVGENTLAAANSATAAAGSATLSQAWAESPTAPSGEGTKSAKTWANEAAVSAAAALAVPPANFTTITANHTATSFSFLALDTSAGAFTLTLPAGGGTVTLRDPNGSWEANPPTIAGNGRTIDGAATLLADLAGYEVTFTSVSGVWRYSLKYLYGG